MYERERNSRKHQPFPYGPQKIHSMRIANLENLLKATEETGASAKVNSLKQVIRRNKTGMAQDARTSMDLMREIFQGEITKEIYQILDRHARTTFSPAIENLRRNGHTVDDAVMSELFTNILEAAKSAFAIDNGLPAENVQLSTMPAHILEHLQQHPLPEIQISRPAGQLPQPITVIPPQPLIPQQLPVKEERFHMDMSPLNSLDVSKWNPERFGLPTLLISTAKVATHMGLTVTSFFGNFPRIFRYTCDEHDRRALVEEGRLREPEASRVYLLCLEDVGEITANVQEIEPFAFCAKEALILKIRRYAQPYFERLLLRQKQAQIQQWQQLEQQRQ